MASGLGCQSSWSSTDCGEFGGRKKACLTCAWRRQATQNEVHHKSLGCSNPRMLLPWVFRDVAFPGTRKVCADLLTTTGVLLLWGAWGIVRGTRVLAVA